VLVPGTLDEATTIPGRDTNTRTKPLALANGHSRHINTWLLPGLGLATVLPAS
jgi:hypothetical protein